MPTEKFARLLQDIFKDYQAYMDEHLAPSLTTAQLTVLEVLHEQEKLKPSDFIPYLSTTPAAVTMLLDRMERGELIQRIRDENDRRIVWVSITPKGGQEAARGVQLRNSYMEQILSRISRHNQQLLVYLLGKISGAKQELKVEG